VAGHGWRPWPCHRCLLPVAWAARAMPSTVPKPGRPSAGGGGAGAGLRAGPGHLPGGRAREQSRGPMRYF